MSVRGVLSVAGVESSKLAAQIKTHLVLAGCLLAPVAFVGAMRVVDNLPVDTLFGRAVKESGFASPLVVLGYATLWAVPALTSIVGGDLFSAEDRYGTWSTLLTRSRSRADVFGGKVLAALAFAWLAVTVLAASSIAAGVAIIGAQPLVDLSGLAMPASTTLSRVALAWISILPPAFSFTALAALLSVATRSSVAGVGLPVALGLAMQLTTLVDGPETVRRLLMTSAFDAWHGLLTQPHYYRPLVDGTLVSSGYVIVCLAIAYHLLRKRDIVA